MKLNQNPDQIFEKEELERKRDLGATLSTREENPFRGLKIVEDNDENAGEGLFRSGFQAEDSREAAEGSLGPGLYIDPEELAWYEKEKYWINYEDISTSDPLSTSLTPIIKDIPRSSQGNLKAAKFEKLNFSVSKKGKQNTTKDNRLRRYAERQISQLRCPSSDDNSGVQKFENFSKFEGKNHKRQEEGLFIKIIYEESKGESRHSQRSKSRRKRNSSTNKSSFFKECGNRIEYFRSVYERRKKLKKKFLDMSLFRLDLSKMRCKQISLFCRFESKMKTKSNLESPKTRDLNQEQGLCALSGEKDKEWFEDGSAFIGPRSHLLVSKAIETRIGEVGLRKMMRIEEKQKLYHEIAQEKEQRFTIFKASRNKEDRDQGHSSCHFSREYCYHHHDHHNHHHHHDYNHKTFPCFFKNCKSTFHDVSQ